MKKTTKKIIALLLICLFLNGCALLEFPGQTVKVVGTTVGTVGKVVQTAGNVVIAGGQVVGKVVEAGGKVIETAVTVPGVKEVITNRIAP